MQPLRDLTHRRLLAALIGSLLLARAAGGQTLWSQELNDPSDDGAYAAATDGSDGAYFIGVTFGSLAGPSAGLGDTWVARFDASGKQVWIHQLGTPNDDECWAAASRSSGGLYVGGRRAAWPGAAGDTWLARYSENLFVLPAFCTAKTALVCGSASIRAIGIPSATAASGFVVQAGPVRECRAGFLLYSRQPAQQGIAFAGPGDGLLCLSSSGLQRAGPVATTPFPQNCTGTMTIDMNRFRSSSWTTTGCNQGPGQTSPAAFLGVMGTTRHRPDIG